MHALADSVQPEPPLLPPQELVAKYQRDTKSLCLRIRVTQLKFDEQVAIVQKQKSKFNVMAERWRRDRKQLDTFLSGSSLSDKAPAPLTGTEPCCSICMGHRPTVTFLPCQHQVTCPACAKCVYKCPMCRTDINSHIVSFVS